MITAVMSWKSELFGQSPGVGSIYDHKETSRHYINERDEDKRAENMRNIGIDHGGQNISRKSSSLNATNNNNTDIRDSMKRNHDRSSQNKKYPRGMLRAKSVEFNFNSSSTDCSVMDYEKVLSGMPQADSDNPLQGPAFRDRPSSRKGRRHEKASKHSNIPSIPVNETGSLWDSSETLTQLDYQSFGNQTTAVSNGEGLDRAESNGDTESGLEISNSKDFENDTNRDFSFNQRNEEYRSSLKPHERFIPLTYNPNLKQSNSMITKEQGFDTESGIDQDPYDNVVNEIKFISLSNDSNAEKLQKVCNLLSIDNLDDRNPLRNRNMSASVMDLSSKRHEIIDYNDDGSFSVAVESVQQMKRNLAKSMEDLNHLIVTEHDVQSRYVNHNQDKFDDNSMSYINGKFNSQLPYLSKPHRYSAIGIDPTEEASSRYIKKTNQSRQFPPNVSSRRNFISPSFLRPASSMKDLSSLGHHPLTIELLSEIERDAEHQTLQALEDLDTSLNVLKQTNEKLAHENTLDHEKYGRNVGESSQPDKKSIPNRPVSNKFHINPTEENDGTENDNKDLDSLNDSSSDHAQNRTNSQITIPESSESALQSFVDQQATDCESIISDEFGNDHIQCIDLSDEDLGR